MATNYEYNIQAKGAGSVVTTVPITLTAAQVAYILAYLGTQYPFATFGYYDIGYDAANQTFYVTSPQTIVAPQRYGFCLFFLVGETGGDRFRITGIGVLSPLERSQ